MRESKECVRFVFIVCVGAYNECIRNNDSVQFEKKRNYCWLAIDSVTRRAIENQPRIIRHY